VRQLSLTKHRFQKCHEEELCVRRRAPLRKPACVVGAGRACTAPETAPSFCKLAMSVTSRRFRGRHCQDGLQSNARCLVTQLTFISPRYGSIKPKDTTPTTLFGCYTPGIARVTRIVRQMSSAADFSIQLASRESTSRTGLILNMK
jgi:hypothetical protein